MSGRPSWTCSAVSERERGRCRRGRRLGGRWPCPPPAAPAEEEEAVTVAVRVRPGGPSPRGGWGLRPCRGENAACPLPRPGRSRNLGSPGDREWSGRPLELGVEGVFSHRSGTPRWLLVLPGLLLAVFYTYYCFFPGTGRPASCMSRIKTGKIRIGFTRYF